MHRKGFIKSIALVAVLVIVLGFVFYYMIPPNIGWPSESRRVVHPNGFSIIMPLDWEEHVSISGPGNPLDSVRLLPAKPVGTPGFLMVTKVSAPPTESDLKSKGFSPTTFQGQPAWEHLRDHALTKEVTRNLAFQRDGVWFQIDIRRPVTESMDVGIWPKYLDSFRVEPIRIAPVFPTTSLAIKFAPTTAPAAATAP